MSNLIQDLEKCGLSNKDQQEPITPEEEIEMLLNRALRDCKLGYMAATSSSIKAALDIFIKLGEKDED